MKFIKLIILKILFISFNCNAAAKIGFLTGEHFITTKLNNNHPFIEVAESILIYKNSFDKTSIALFIKNKEGPFYFRIGLTTGYQKNMTYNNINYESPFTISGISPFLVPSIEYNIQRITLIGAIVGNSANVGLSLTFN